jgi:hypothetical protein
MITGKSPEITTGTPLNSPRRTAATGRQFSGRGTWPRLGNIRSQDTGSASGSMKQSTPAIPGKMMAGLPVSLWSSFYLTSESREGDTVPYRFSCRYNLCSDRISPGQKFIPRIKETAGKRIICTIHRFLPFFVTAVFTRASRFRTMPEFTVLTEIFFSFIVR